MWEQRLWMDRDGCSMRATLWLTVVEGGGVPPVGVVRGYSDLHGSRRPLAWPHVDARFLEGYGRLWFYVGVVDRQVSGPINSATTLTIRTYSIRTARIRSDVPLAFLGLAGRCGHSQERCASCVPREAKPGSMVFHWGAPVWKSRMRRQFSLIVASPALPPRPSAIHPHRQRVLLNRVNGAGCEH